jgi:excisionase family DNA binding protein
MNGTERLLYRPKEAADALGIGLTKLYELMETGEVPWIRVGATRRIPIDVLRERIVLALAKQRGAA